MANLILDANEENCSKSMCGYWDQADTESAVDDNGQAFLLGCAEKGYVGSRQTCGPGADPRCSSFASVVAQRDNGQGLACRAEASQMPQMTKATMPTVTGTAQLTTPSPQPVVTTTWMNQRMPSIVNPAPVNVAPCDPFAQWVDDNELLIGLALGLATLWAFGKLGGGR